MNENRLNKILAAFFLLVGILAMVNTYRLGNYISSTVPRDDAQEQCQEDTLGVLRSWVGGRFLRDATIDTRDDATIVVLDRLIAAEKPTPAELQRWRDAVISDNEERARSTQLYHNLPNC